MAVMLIALLFVTVAAGNLGGNTPAWAKPRQRAQALLARMTLPQKINMLHPSAGSYAGQTAPIPELGIPSLTMQDGPQGVADGVKWATAWPSELTVTQSWDLSLFRKYSAAMGQEQYIKGTGVMLGPMVNLARVAEGGRVFEGMGEDPFLTSRMVEQSVIGIQSQGVMANVKHYLNNDFDGIKPSSRFNMSIEVDELTQYYYLQPFIAAVNAGALSVMCSYNRINSVFACENNYTLSLLKKTLGFQGFVVSDWGATHSTIPSALAGLDVEMGTDRFFSDALLKAVEQGHVPESVIDDKTLRVLTAMFAIGLFDRNNTGNLGTHAISPAHSALARELSARSMVLLKNTLLPLNPDSKLRIAVAGSGNIICGGGSGHVLASPTWVTAWDGLANVSAKWTVTHSPMLLGAALQCEQADVCVVVVGSPSSEGEDRRNLSLNILQLALVEGILALKKPTIVVIQSAAPVLVSPFFDQAVAVISAGFAGQEFGNALADVMSGAVTPQGRLAVTWPSVSSRDSKLFSEAQWPGVRAKDPCTPECMELHFWPYYQATYSEGPYFGYRFYDRLGSGSGAPGAQFPFGFGLSYTTFVWSGISATNSSVSVVVTNAGTKLNGIDVVQLYVAYPAEYNQPLKQLKGFAKTQLLAPGASERVSIELLPELLVWKPGVGEVPATGTFTAIIARDAGHVVTQLQFTR